MEPLTGDEDRPSLREDVQELERRLDRIDVQARTAGAIAEQAVEGPPQHDDHEVRSHCSDGSESRPIGLHRDVPCGQVSEDPQRRFAEE